MQFVVHPYVGQVEEQDKDMLNLHVYHNYEQEESNRLHYAGFTIFSFFILERRVLGLIPRIMAAPVSP